jgi:hypothetical protein
MANDYDFDASGYPPEWLPPMTPQSLYGNGAWNAFAAMLGNGPNALGRFGAMSNEPLAPADNTALPPGYVLDRNGAWNDDRRAAGSEVTNWLGASGAVDTSKPAMFTMAELYGLGLRPHHAPATFDALERLVDGVPAAAGSTAADAPRAFTLADVEAERRNLGEIAAGQSGLDAVAAAIAHGKLGDFMTSLAPKDLPASDPAATRAIAWEDRAPAQWWRPETSESQSRDALTNAQPMSWPQPPERSDLRSWAPNQQPMMQGRETGPSDLTRMFAGFGQGNIPTNFWNGNQGGADPQWGRRGAQSFQSSDAPTDAQPTSAPVLPEQRDSKGWWPNQQATNQGRETGPSDSEWWAPDFDTDDPLVPAAYRPGRKRPKREPLPPPPDQRGGLPIDPLEEEARGGHGFAKHVGKHEERLIRQVRERFAEDPGARDVRSGTFLSDQAGKKLMNSTLAQNKTIVDEVAAGRLDDATVFSDFGSLTAFEARAAHRGSSVHFHDTTGVRVHIFHNPRSPTGYTVRSYYPSNKD